MGYVDAATMIEIKNKIKDRISRKEDVEDRSVCIKLVNGTVISEPIFEDYAEYEEGAAYSIAVGNSKNGFYLRKNNGWEAKKQDYKHQRKRYLDLSLDTSKRYPDLEDLISVLLGPILYSAVGLKKLWNDKYFLDADGRWRHTIKAEFSKKEGSSFPEDWPLAKSLVNHSDGVINTMKTICIFDSIDGKGRASYTKIGSVKLYIVKNAYDRADQGFIAPHLYCEGVYGYLHLLIGLRSVLASPEEAVLSISTLKD